MYVNLIITLFVLVTSSWVAYDATKNKMGSPESDSPNPFKIAFGCLVLWVLVFPYYLFKRSKFIESAKQNPIKENKEKGFIYAFVIVGTLFVGLSLRQVALGDLPSCDSLEVVSLVQEIAEDNYGKGFEFSAHGQKSYNNANEERVCRVSWSNQSDKGILNYKVEWYSEKKESFVVEFL